MPALGGVYFGSVRSVKLCGPARLGFAVLS
jgi:hypothetical protein